MTQEFKSTSSASVAVVIRTRSTRRSVESKNFELQPFVFDDFAFLGNASGEFADQAGYGGGFVAFGTHAEEFIEAVYIHVAGDYVGVVVFLHYLRFLVLIADFSYYFFYQVFDSYQAGYASVFIYYYRHADVTALHLAQQVTY